MKKETGFLKLFSCAVLIAAAGACAVDKGNTFESRWPEDIERVWVGPEYWANRLQDWWVRHGRLECLRATLHPLRTVHLLTFRLKEGPGGFRISVRLGLLNPGGKAPDASAAGFLIGAGGRGMDYRAAALIHGRPGRGAGLFAAVDSTGEVFFRDLYQGKDPGPSRVRLDSPTRHELKEAFLDIEATPMEGTSAHLLHLTCRDAAGRLLSEDFMKISSDRLIGNIALVSHSGSVKRGQEGYRYWFQEWKFSGEKVDHDPSRSLGPILAAQHTLSRGILKMTVQMMPLGDEDNDAVSFEVKEGGAWKRVDQTRIIRPGFTAPFRVENWDDTRDIPYRVVYRMKTGGGREKTFTWGGVVRKDPRNKETLVIAGFTGNHNVSHGIGVGRGGKDKIKPADWIAGLWFPHADLTRRVWEHEPDVLFFSGDQVYEGNSPTYSDTAHIKLDYLYKWFLWCWAYRDLFRDIPTVTIPDDHDVYQGNLWGEGGRKTDRDNKGGYVHPADFVKMVERTQTSHLPDPPDPEPVDQGIGVYFTHMRYGRIGFAILEDRKFKSGCNGRVKGKTRGRADHINDPDFDMKDADVPGCKLLGDRQLRFLDRFCADWEGEDMKMALSQTIFANMATHHGGNLFRLIADLDSNGWPKTGRNKALAALRRGFVFHLAGDQHLASLVHHGIDEPNDAIWSFCVPSVANFYPRAWLPEAKGKNRPEGAPPNMGEHLDGLGNRVTVYAVTNPANITGVSTGREPLELHDKMPGYGIVKLDKNTREITVECWPRYVDPKDPSTGDQYPGWPRTIPQQDNYSREAAAWLPTIVSTGLKDPVVQVIAEATGEIVYTLRIKGTDFRPKVFEPGRYTVSVGEPGTDRMMVFEGLEPLPQGEEKTLTVTF